MTTADQAEPVSGTPRPPPDDGRYDDNKRRRTYDNAYSDEPSREIFISNIPYNVSQAGIESALKRMFGKLAGFDCIRKVLLHRGFAFLAFKTHEEAVAAVNSTQNQQMGPRKLNVQISNPNGSRGGRTEVTNQEIGSNTAPDPDCWFCLANPSFERHLIVSVEDTASVYTSLAKGQITDGHILVCPVTHFGCYAQADENVRRKCDNTVSEMKDFYNSRSQDTVIYERWIPLSATAANHMQIHLIPVSRDICVDWKAILKDKGKQSGVEFQKVDSHEEVVEKMKGILNKVSYIFFSFPGLNGETENYLGMGRLSFTFPREVVCSGLDKLDRIDWKRCELETSVEEEQASSFRNELKQFREHST